MAREAKDRMTESQEKRSLLLESWLEFNDIIAEHPEVRRLLFDPVTGLPTTPLLFPVSNRCSRTAARCRCCASTW